MILERDVSDDGTTIKLDSLEQADKDPETG